MHISISYPLFDGRQFSSGGDSRLSRPTYPPNEAQSAFIRNMGALRNRPLGGFRGWIGEDYFCDVSSSLTVPTHTAKHLRSLRKRFYYSGGHVGHLEFSFTPAHKVDDILASRKVFIDFIKRVTEFQIGSKHYNGFQSSLCASAILEQNFVQGTSVVSTEDQLPVKFGPPVITVIMSGMPSYYKRSWAGSIGSSFSATPSILQTGLVVSGVKSFVIQSMGRRNEASARFARTGLHRMYAELFAFENMVAWLISPEAEGLDSASGAMFAEQLATSMRRLTGRERPTFSGIELEYEFLVDQFSQLHQPGRIDELMEALRRVGARPNLQRSVANAIRLQFSTDGNTYFAGDYIMGDKVNGDKYENSGQVGAMGRNAKVGSVSFDMSRSTGAELSELAKELQKLVSALSAAATTDQERAQIDALNAAEQAAAAGDKSKLTAALKGVGPWALGAATAIGTGLAVAAIKGAAGI